MARILIGSYVLDSADTSSSSTTSGVQLDLDDELPLSPEIEDSGDGGSEYRWPLFYAVVTAASESALKTAVDAVEAAIMNCSGKTIIYEETSGTTLLTMDTGTWPQATGRVVKEQGQLTCEIAFSFIGRRAGTVATGGSDETGQIGAITWEYEISAGGIAGMIARATFAATSGAGARENAKAWITKLRNTANYSAEAPWLDTAFRCVGALVEFDQKANQSSVTEASYDPARVTMTFRELHSTIGAHANWPTKAVSANWRVGMTERNAINRRASSDPGYDITLFGDVTLKTQGNTTFNSSEEKLTDAELYSTARTAVLAIITHFETIYAALNLTRWGEPVINLEPVEGTVTFAVKFTAAANVLEWEESCTVTNRFLKRRNRATDGSSWKYEQAGGPERIVQHSLRIVALTPIPYKPPVLSTNWDEDEASLQPTIEMKYNNGVVEYHTSGQKTWVYMNPSPTQGQGQTTTLSPIGIDGIGNGVL